MQSLFVQRGLRAGSLTWRGAIQAHTSVASSSRSTSCAGREARAARGSTNPSRRGNIPAKVQVNSIFS
jgi:hypothetical protein